MRFLLSRLGRYLLLEALKGFGLILAAISATILLVDVVEQLRILESHAPMALFSALQLTAMKAPQMLDQTLPFVALAGSMFAITQLNRRSELAAIRASGVSAWRFLSPALVLAAAAGLASSLVVNPLATSLYGAYERQKAALLSEPGAARADVRANVWLRQGDEAGQVVIHAKGVDPERARLSDVLMFFYEFEENGDLTFVRRAQAQSAELTPGFWRLSHVVEAAPSAPVKRFATMAIPTTMEPTALLDRYVSANTLSFWRLPHVIGDARAAGLAPRRYELRFQSLLAAPLFLAAMAAIGAIYSLRLQRLGGQARAALTGLAVGFILYFFAQFSAAYASSGVIPAALAAWAPGMAGLFAALAALISQEDG